MGSDNFSTVVSATAVLIQWVGSEQKLQTADFRCITGPAGSTLPPPAYLASWGVSKIQGWNQGQSDIGQCTPAPRKN